MATPLHASAPVISFRSAPDLKRASKRGAPDFKKYFLFLWLLATLAVLPYALSSLADRTSSTGVAESVRRRDVKTVGTSHWVRRLKAEGVPGDLSSAPGLRRSLLQAPVAIAADEELIIASRNGDLDKVIDLIRNNLADAGFRAPATGTTPIIEAAYGGHADVVKELISYGADVNAVTTETGVSALWFAAYGGYADVVEVLLSEVDDIDQSDKNDTTPLYIAALNGHLAVVELLADRGASIDTPSISGATALTAAVHNGHNDIIKFLLDSGADPNVTKTLSGQSNLWTATYLQNDEAVKLLIESRADVTKPANDKTTPLYISMVRGCLRCAVLLLDAGASPDDEASLNNWSPLHAAAATGFVEGVQLLLDRGADKNVQDNLTRRPIDVIGRTKKLDPSVIERLEDLLTIDNSDVNTVSAESDSDHDLRTLDVIDATRNSSLSPVKLSDARDENTRLGESSSGSSTSLTLWAIILLACLGGLVAIQAVFIVMSKRANRSEWSGSQHSPWRGSLNPRASTQRYGATSPVTVASPVAARTSSLDSCKHPFSPTQNVPPAPDSPETRRPAGQPVLESLTSDLEDSVTRGAFERPVDMDTVQQMYTTRESQYDGYGNYTSRRGEQSRY